MGFQILIRISHWKTGNDDRISEPTSDFPPMYRYIVLIVQTGIPNLSAMVNLGLSHGGVHIAERMRVTNPGTYQWREIGALLQTQV